MDVKYAYLYGEGTGYLHVAPLGEGTQGTASLVRSIEDGKTYVRKAGLYDTPFGSASNEGDWCPEHHPHPVITTCSRLCKTHCTLISRYCNGGSIEDLYFRYWDNSMLVPEGLIWRMVVQLINALVFLHRECRPAISHRDICPGNVLVDWPSDPSSPPNFILGDFGFSTVHDVAEFPQNSEERHDEFLAASDFAGDYARVSAVAYVLMTGDTDDRTCEKYINKVQVRKYYSQELIACAEELFQFSRILEGNINTDIAPLLARIEINAKSRKTDDAILEVGRPKRETLTPRLFHSPEALMNHVPKPPGPWNLAAVDSHFNVVALYDSPQCQSKVWFTDASGDRVHVETNPYA